MGGGTLSSGKRRQLSREASCEGQWGGGQGMAGERNAAAYNGRARRLLHAGGFTQGGAGAQGDG